MKKIYSVGALILLLSGCGAIAQKEPDTNDQLLLMMKQKTLEKQLFDINVKNDDHKPAICKVVRKPLVLTCDEIKLIYDRKCPQSSTIQIEQSYDNAEVVEDEF